MKFTEFKKPEFLQKWYFEWPFLTLLGFLITLIGYKTGIELMYGIGLVILVIAGVDYWRWQLDFTWQVTENGKIIKWELYFSLIIIAILLIFLLITTVNNL